MVSCWHVDGKTRPTSTFSGTSQHNSEITILKWNPIGKRVITGDKVLKFSLTNTDQVLCRMELLMFGLSTVAEPSHPQDSTAREVTSQPPFFV
jgi:WD40 repeat protein